MSEVRRGARCSRVGLVLGAGVAALLVASAAWAASFSSPTTIGQAGDSRGFPQIASNATGDSLVVWHDYQQTKGRIQAQPIAPDGTLGDAVTLSDTSADSNNPAVGVDGAGVATVAWNASAAQGTKVQVTRVNPTGVQTGVSELGEGGDAEVAVNDAGRAIVAWNDYPALRAAVIEPDGSVGPVQTLYGEMPDFDESAEVVIDAAGRATVVWQGEASGKPAVLGSRFSADGAAAPPALISRGKKPAYPGGAAIDGAGVTTATWSKRSGEMMATRISADGEVAKPKTLGDTKLGSGPSIVMDDTDVATVAWADAQKNKTDLHWVQLPASGGPSKERSLGKAAVSSMGVDGAGRVTVAWNWSVYKESSYKGSIRAVRLKANGKAGKVQKLSAKSENTYDFQGGVQPSVAVSESGTARVVWPNVKPKNAAVRYAESG